MSNANQTLVGKTRNYAIGLAAGAMLLGTTGCTAPKAPKMPDMPWDRVMGMPYSTYRLPNGRLHYDGAFIKCNPNPDATWTLVEYKPGGDSTKVEFKPKAIYTLDEKGNVLYVTVPNEQVFYAASRDDISKTVVGNAQSRADELLDIIEDAVEERTDPAFE